MSENEVSGDKFNSNVKAGKLTDVTILKLSHRARSTFGLMRLGKATGNLKWGGLDPVG